MSHFGRNACPVEIVTTGEAGEQDNQEEVQDKRNKCFSEISLLFTVGRILHYFHSLFYSPAQATAKQSKYAGAAVNLPYFLFRFADVFILSNSQQSKTLTTFSHIRRIKGSKSSHFRSWKREHSGIIMRQNTI